MTGTLFGVGVGPGDPELLTIKAVNCLKKCQVIAMPKSGGKSQIAYEIALMAVPEIQYKQLLELPMPMIKDKTALKEAHDIASNMLAQILETQDVAFLTLGDPSVYATFSYLQKNIQKRGGHCEVVAGVPSFCAAAAALQTPLAEGGEMLHMIPASYPIDLALTLPGTKVFMKSGSQYGTLRDALAKQKATVNMVENCGMGENERLYYSLKDMPETAGYFALIIVKS